MNQIIQREYTTKKVVDDDLLLEHGVYCTAPWTSLQIKNDGTMSYCCVSRDPIGLTLNAKELVEGRKRIRRGEILPSCKEACYHTDYVSQRNSLNTMAVLLAYLYLPAALFESSQQQRPLLRSSLQ